MNQEPQKLSGSHAKGALLRIHLETELASSF
jgi:hypothetical protein